MPNSTTYSASVTCPNIIYAVVGRCISAYPEDVVLAIIGLQPHGSNVGNEKKNTGRYRCRSHKKDQLDRLCNLLTHALSEGDEVLP